MSRLIDPTGAPLGITPEQRKVAKAMTQNATVGDVHMIAAQYANATIEQVARNFPALVEHMIRDIAARNGWPLAEVQADTVPSTVPSSETVQ